MENLTGGTPPVRYLPCVVPCKLYFAMFQSPVSDDTLNRVICDEAEIDRYKDNYIAIGIRISYYRKLRGLSQEQLAERAGLSVGFLSQVEAPGMVVGVSLNTIFAIAEVLGIEPYKLLKFDE